jgi:uncharacterized membrane protein SpoIIM required for sporulation
MTGERMKSKMVKKILLITLILTVLVAAFFNFYVTFTVFNSLNIGEIPQVRTQGKIGTMFSCFNIALFLFIVLYYHYKKKNLWFILLPYAGSIIFGLINLLRRDK